MIEVKRISPARDVTLEITAPERLWEVLTNILGARQANSTQLQEGELVNTFPLLQALKKEFTNRKTGDYGGFRSSYLQ